MHFFNPVPVLKLVEVIRTAHTSEETTAAIVRLAEELAASTSRRAASAGRPGVASSSTRDDG